MTAQLGWQELDTAAFTERLEECLAVYAAAMSPPADQLPGRRIIMARHAVFPGFRGLAATRDGQPSSVIAFAYGFHGESGQWWHDLVTAAIAVTAGQALANRWLADSFEIGEVHVHPDYQRIGVGRRMVLALTAGRTESTAVLSTRDARSPARHLYRKLGFTDLLTAFRFPGGPESYAVMGAALPLLPEPL